MKLLYSYHQLNSHSQRFITTFKKLLGNSFEHCLNEDLEKKSNEFFDVLLFGPIHLPLKKQVAQKFKKVVGIAWAWEVWLAIYEDQSHQLAIKLNMNLFDALVVDANYVAVAVDEMTGIKVKNIFSLPWGLDIEKFSSLPIEAARYLRHQHGLDQRKVYYSTRPLDKKFGLDHLLRTFKKLLKDDPSSFLVLANSGADEGELRHQVKQDQLESSIFFLGKRPETDIILWMCLADYYVSSAPTDGSSLSLLEGMICGKRAIVQSFPSNREWIENEQEGILVDFKKAEVAAKEIQNYTQAHPPTMNFLSRDKMIARADWAKNSQKLVEFLLSLS